MPATGLKRATVVEVVSQSSSAASEINLELTGDEMSTIQLSIQELKSRVHELEASRTADLEARALLTEVHASLAKDEQNESTIEPPETGDDGDEKEENLYSFSLEMLLFPENALSACTHTFRLALLTFSELILSFGFFDAGWLGVYQGNTNLLGGPIAESVFYPTASIAYVAGGNAVPTINVICSVVGLLLLAQVMHTDTVVNLHSAPPLVLLCYLLVDSNPARSECERSKTTPAGAGSAPPQKARDAPRVGPWQVFACILLQFAWIVRCLYMPVAIALGTALSLASANSAQDVVMNAVAVGFLFDLDAMAYEGLVPPKIKEDYQTRCISALPTRAIQATKDTNFLWSYLCGLTDMAFMTGLYVIQAWALAVDQPYQNEYWFFSAYLYVRGGFFGLMHVRGVLAYLWVHKGSVTWRQGAVQIAGMLVGVLISCFGSGAAAWNLQRWLGWYLGAYTALPGSALEACLNDLMPTSECSPNNAMFINSWRTPPAPPDVGTYMSYDMGWVGVG